MFDERSGVNGARKDTLEKLCSKIASGGEFRKKCWRNNAGEKCGECFIGHFTSVTFSLQYKPSLSNTHPQSSEQLQRVVAESQDLPCTHTAFSVVFPPPAEMPINTMRQLLREEKKNENRQTFGEAKLLFFVEIASTPLVASPLACPFTRVASHAISGSLCSRFPETQRNDEMLNR
jgi:hypothetical protein